MKASDLIYELQDSLRQEGIVREQLARVEARTREAEARLTAVLRERHGRPVMTTRTIAKLVGGVATLVDADMAYDVVVAIDDDEPDGSTDAADIVPASAVVDVDDVILSALGRANCPEVVP